MFCFSRCCDNASELDFEQSTTLNFQYHAINQTSSRPHHHLAMADQKSQAALFQVYLRLRPPPTNQQIATERFLSVEEPANDDELPTHITLNPPNDNRRRAVEKFAFTTVFEEEATQLNLFHGTGVLPLVEGVLGPQGGDGRDGLLATLGVTGSGKVHRYPSKQAIGRY
jgi:hypothetical protein